ncbi:hypothetical protein [Sphaerothrix gracilis]|uniref:hypothetical protein n=1 Tax=Sphaerothrix gracilis TaxID=3151835 RepID=UPI0031FC5931
MSNFDWFRKPIVRGLLLVLLPLIAGGLFLVTTRLATTRSPTSPTSPEAQN